MKCDSNFFFHTVLWADKGGEGCFSMRFLSGVVHKLRWQARGKARGISQMSKILHQHYIFVVNLSMTGVGGQKQSWVIWNTLSLGGLHGFQFGGMELPNFQKLATTSNKNYNFRGFCPTYISPKQSPLCISI